MVNSRQSLIEAITAYQSSFAEEISFRKPFLELLNHPRCYHRDHLPGHITGSAWIIDESGQFILLTHHAKLNRWLQPGGHADGDEDVFAVALREAEEETGLSNIAFPNRDIFDIDIHTIPARKDFPEHLHFDVRFCFLATRNAALTVTSESKDLKWIALHELPVYTEANSSILRMCQKSLATAHQQ